MNIRDSKAIKARNDQHIKEFKKGLITGVLINAKEKRVEIQNKLQEFYRYLDCDLIDIVYRTVNGVPVCIVIDDEGLLKDGYIVSAFGDDGIPQLVGNLLVFSQRTDDDGNMFGLTDAECGKVITSIDYYFNHRTHDAHIALMGLEY